MPRRSRIDIIENILSLLSANKNMKPTHLMYKANLSNVQMKGYLDELLKKSFIDKQVGDRDNSYFTITEQGRRFLGKIKEMKEFEETFGLD